MESFIWKHRNPLVNTMKAIKNGKLTLGSIGGSITDARGFHNWPEPVAAWFVENFPETQIVVENAAIGATSSDLAVFRAERDLSDRGCNLVFVEYAVNDYGMERTRRFRTREGLLRKLLKNGNCDVVCVYTFIQDMFNEMAKYEVPQTVSDFEELCEHYQLGSVWMSRYALDEVLKGRMRWEEWLPDGLHPKERGSFSYATSVIKYLEKELADFSNMDKVLQFPEPRDPLNWENTAFIPFDQVDKTGPWLIRRSVDSTWMDLILCTSAPGSKLKIEFEGRAILIGFDFGKRSAEMKYCLDGGVEKSTFFEKAEWVPDSTMFLLRSFGEDLSEGKHILEIESVNVSKLWFSGSRCEVAFIGVVR